MEHDKIAKALVGFQADMENVTKDAVNPFFKSKYATLENILTAAKPHLAKHGLAVVQLPDGDQLRTIIVHESGQSIEASATLHIKDQTPQAQGSAITYMRRYALSAALGIATEEDDDGNEASKPKAPIAAKTASGAKKTDDPYKADKLKIASLVKQLGHVNVDKDTYPDLIHRLTGLELIHEAYPQIVERLTALVEERNQQ